MTNKKIPVISRRSGIEICIVIVVGVSLALFVIAQKNNTKKTSFFSSASPQVSQMPLPTVTPKGPVRSVMDSPEGSRTLTLEKEGNSYTLSVTTKSDGQTISIFSKNETTSQSIEIPFNTWSTDNNYVFLKEITPLQTNFIVIQSSGNLFSNNSRYIIVNEFFKERLPNYELVDVTGWAGNTSLIVNAKETVGSGKVSFWFEVPSLYFIPLSTYFK